MVRSHLVAGLLCLFAVACYGPKPSRCSIQCAEDRGCPIGTSCASDGFCHEPDSRTSCLAAGDYDGGVPAPDAEPTPPDASPCPMGQVCDDNSICTENDKCNASGVCTGDPVGTLVYRFSDGTSSDSHYRYSINATPPGGYSLDAQAFRLPPAGSGTLTDLYQKHSTQADDYMLTLDSGEADGLGYTVDTTLGQVYMTEQPGTKGLYRYAQASPLRHFSTINPAEQPSGYTDEAGIKGYVCPP